MAQLKKTRSKDKQKRPTAKRTRCPRDRRRFVFYLCTQTQFLTRGKISPRRRCNCCNLFLSGPSVSFCIMNENRRGPTPQVQRSAQCHAIGCWVNASLHCLSCSTRGPVSSSLTLSSPLKGVTVGVKKRRKAQFEWAFFCIASTHLDR